jgi:hypothetical protein
VSAQLLRGVEHSAYHADRLPGSPLLSRSAAHDLLTRSPYHVEREHPALGGGPGRGVTDAMNAGNLYHSLFLGGGQEVVPVKVHTNKDKLGSTVPAVDYRKTEAQEIKKAALSSGAIPVLPHELEEARVAVERIRERILGFGVPLDLCDTEVTALWEEPTEYGLVSCKARFDLLFEDSPGPDSTVLKLWDPKFPDKKGKRRASPYAFQRSLPFTSYPMQAYSYVRALEVIFPGLAGQVTFEGFLWSETWEPYDVALVPIPTSLLALGKARWERAVAKWGECLKTGVWPGYGRLAAMEAPAALEGELAVDLTRDERIDALFGEEELT